MTDPLDFDRINAEVLFVGENMRNCLDDFVNFRITREEYDEMMSSYADRIDVARHKQDELYAAFGEMIQKIQEHTEPVSEQKMKKKN